MNILQTAPAIGYAILNSNYPMFDTVGRRVWMVRIWAKMNRREFADHCGLSSSAVWNIEFSQTKAKSSSLEKIARRTGADVNWLKSGDWPVAVLTGFDTPGDLWIDKMMWEMGAVGFMCTNNLRALAAGQNQKREGL